METTVVIKQEQGMRRIPEQSKWFDYHIDSIVYSFMVASATARIKPGDKKDGSESYLYLSQSKYKKIRPMIRKITGKTARQIGDQVKKLIEEGYIAFNQENKQYTFPFDYNENYYMVSRDVLAYLCTVSNPFVIKIYFYLADKFRFKKDYHFTLKELRIMLGYSPNENERVTTLIKLALSSLSIMGFIDYKSIKVKLESNGKVIDNLQLKNVIGKRLPERITKELTEKLSIEGKQVVGLLLE